MYSFHTTGVSNYHLKRSRMI